MNSNIFQRDIVFFIQIVNNTLTVKWNAMKKVEDFSLS